MRLAHGRIEIELYQLARGEGRPLLLLHELYGSAASMGEGFSAWRGPLWALDFAGHGRSKWIRGGAYTPEILACDVDAALRHIGPSAIAGAGVGAYVAQIVAAARKDSVPAALLLPGAGLAGGGAAPDFSRPARPLLDTAAEREGCDRMVSFLDIDVRPPDYAASFARQVNRLVLLEDGTARPPWWEASRRGANVVRVGDLTAGLAAL